MTIAMLAAIAASGALQVIDGDTLIIGAEKIRLVGVDAPEISGAKCPAERALGRLAADRLRMLTKGKSVDVDRSGFDRYGRTLAVILVDGDNVGSALIAEGYARRWPQRRGWCER